MEWNYSRNMWLCFCTISVWDWLYFNIYVSVTGFALISCWSQYLFKYLLQLYSATTFHIIHIPFTVYAHVHAWTKMMNIHLRSFLPPVWQIANWANRGKHFQRTPPFWPWQYCRGQRTRDPSVVYPFGYYSSRISWFSTLHGIWEEAATAEMNTTISCHR